MLGIGFTEEIKKVINHEESIQKNNDHWKLFTSDIIHSPIMDTSYRLSQMPL
jgi:hypothetical protein